MPRRTPKRPTSKKRPQPAAFSVAIILPAILIGALIGFMPSLLTGSLSWSWFMTKPSSSSMDIPSEPSMVEQVVPDPACCVGSDAYYGFTDMQCAEVGGTWDPNGLCGQNGAPDLPDPFAGQE